MSKPLMSNKTRSKKQKPCQQSAVREGLYT